jgi:DNA-binding NtrC family response regulator
MEAFFTTSDKIQHIIKGFNLTKTLFVSSIIIGEAHTGKKTLARYLFPNAILISGKNQKEVELALEHYDELIITDFEKLINQRQLNFTNKRIIATANYMGNSSMIDELFAFIYAMPSLQERPEDISFLSKKFIQEAQSTLILENRLIDLENVPLNLTQNNKSLRQSIYYYLTKQNMSINDISDMLYAYFYTHYEGNDNYRKHIHIFEKPLIEAGLKKYGSQLKLSNALGINRNTLRKKIHEHHID